MNDKAQGTVNELKGKAEKTYGNVTDNPNAQGQGDADQLKGKGEKVVGDVKNAVNDATDSNS